MIAVPLRSTVVHEVQVHGFTALEPADHARGPRHADAPPTGHVAHQRVQTLTGPGSEIAEIAHLVQHGQHAPRLRHQVARQSLPAILFGQGPPGVGEPGPCAAIHACVRAGSAWRDPVDGCGSTVRPRGGGCGPCPAGSRAWRRVFPVSASRAAWGLEREAVVVSREAGGVPGRGSGPAGRARRIPDRPGQHAGYTDRFRKYMHC